MSFSEENVGKFTIAYISYFSESGIWLGKILVNGVRFAKFAQVFPPKILCYTVINIAGGMCSLARWQLSYAFMKSLILPKHILWISHNTSS